MSSSSLSLSLDRRAEFDLTDRAVVDRTGVDDRAGVDVFGSSSNRTDVSSARNARSGCSRIFELFSLLSEAGIGSGRPGLTISRLRGVFGIAGMEPESGSEVAVVSPSLPLLLRLLRRNEKNLCFFSDRRLGDSCSLCESAILLSRWCRLRGLGRVDQPAPRGLGRR